MSVKLIMVMLVAISLSGILNLGLKKEDISTAPSTVVSQEKIQERTSSKKSSSSKKKTTQSSNSKKEEVVNETKETETTKELGDKKEMEGIKETEESATSNTVKPIEPEVDESRVY